MKKLFELSGGQKFFTFLLLFIWVTVYFAVDKLSENGAIELLTWSSVAFVLGHTATDILLGRGKK